jgi:hypothetical protein
MSLREMPQFFVCDACTERQHLDVLCTATASPAQLLCGRCCGCSGHRRDDPGGIAVFAAQAGRLTWCGLDGRAGRARKHT